MKVTPRARRHPDRGGDPLDGLVNLFDLGIVLSVAFLLAALSSLKLTEAITDNGLKPTDPGTVIVQPGEEVHEVPEPGGEVIGKGSKVGTVYRLPDGRLVYVTGGDDDTSGDSESPGE